MSIYRKAIYKMLLKEKNKVKKDVLEIKNKETIVSTSDNMYDVIIVGGGIGGLMTAYKLISTNNKIKIAIIEKGNPLHKRVCVANRARACQNCNPCNITEGIAGAGGLSDFKFLKSLNAYGGDVEEILGHEVTQKLLDEVDETFEKFGDRTEVHYPSKKLQKECIKHDLLMLGAPLKHIGTDNGQILMQKIVDYLIENGVTIITNTNVNTIRENKGSSSVPIKTDIVTQHSSIVYHYYPNEYPYTISISNLKTNKNEFYLTKRVVVAVGRNGADFVKEFCVQNNIETLANKVDVGVRFECPSNIWEDVSKVIYEPKILYKTKCYGDKVRTFCYNHNAWVTNENTNGTVAVNGHAYKDPSKGTENCNFAILVSLEFDTPFNEPILYAESIAKMCNLIGDGKAVVQQFGKLLEGRRSTEKSIAEGSVKPTLKASPCDLSMAIPKRILDDIIEFIFQLDKIAEGTANKDNLLYATELKRYSVKLKFKNDYFEVKDGVYVIGDCNGYGHSISSASVMGYRVAEKLSAEL